MRGQASVGRNFKSSNGTCEVVVRRESMMDENDDDFDGGDGDDFDGEGDEEERETTLDVI